MRCSGKPFSNPRWSAVPRVLNQTLQQGWLNRFLAFILDLLHCSGAGSLRMLVHPKAWGSLSHLPAAPTPTTLPFPPFCWQLEWKAFLLATCLSPRQRGSPHLYLDLLYLHSLYCIYTSLPASLLGDLLIFSGVSIIPWSHLKAPNVT